MFTKKFWKDTFERVVSTMAQFLTVLGGANGTGFLSMSLGQIAVMTALGGLATLLKALAASGINQTDSASLVE